MVASRRFGELIRGLAEDCDLVIVDAPAMLPVGDTAALAPWVDALLYVADPTKLRRLELEHARQQLSQLPCRKLGVVFMAANHRHGYYYT
jgi:Mrp family chromosome partitioning ATPase